MSSPKDSPKQPGPLPAAPDGKASASSEPSSSGYHYYPEDERSPLEKEDDHSHAHVDVDAEIERKFSDTAAAPDTAAGGHESFQDTDDLRPCYEGEGDHSMADFDLDAEIEAKLGKAPEEIPEQRELAPSAGTAAPVEPSTPLPAELPDKDEEFHDSDDIRPCFKGEGDHSITDFDLDAEIDAQLKKRAAERGESEGSGSGGLPAAATHAGEVYYEDERSTLEWEDDHSHVDPAQHGHGPRAASVAEAETRTAESHAAPETGEAMHPDLASSLVAFQAFQGRQDGAEDRDIRDAAASAPQAASVPGDKPEIDAGDNGDFADPQNADGSLSESGYLETALVSAAGEKLPAENGVDETDLRDRPLPEAKSADKAAGEAAPGAEEAVTAPVVASGKSLAEDDENDDAEDGNGGGRDDRPPPPAVGGGGGKNGGSADSDAEEEDSDDKPMTLRDHLRELRKRLLRAFLWILGGFLVCYPFNEDLFRLLMQPLIEVMPKTSHFIFTNPPEAFFTYMKVAFVAGIFLSSPMVFYQLWAFVAPGLYKEEKLYVVPVAIFSAVFFICGGAFCYFIGLPFVFEFFMSYNTGLIQAMPSLKETLSFVLQLLLAFGLVFELPLFIFFLARLGIVTADMMRRFRRYSILANVVVAAILTPPDVMSQLLMAGPLIVLYEISILIAAVFGRKKAKPEQEEEEEDGEEEKAGNK